MFYELRTLNEALEENEFAIQSESKRALQQQREQAQVQRDARTEKIAQRNPWLADVAQAPRRRRSFN